MLRKGFFLFLVVAALTVLVLAHSENSSKLDVQFQGDSFFEGLKIVNRKNGITEWVLMAKRADMTKDGKQAVLSGVEVRLEKQGMIVAAESGSYNMETEQISVEGVLQAQNSNYTFRTSQALIDGSKGNFNAAGNVSIKGRNFELEGKGLQADNTNHKVRILKDVKATFNR